MTKQLIAQEWLRDVQEDAGWTEVKELVYVMVRDRPADAWSLVLELVEAATSDLLLANVAAGPVEDLLAHHGEVIVAEVERAAVHHPKLRSCLEMVWGEGRIEERVRLRVQAAALDS